MRLLFDYLVCGYVGDLGVNMFSISEKRKIAEEIEKLLLSFNHPEMPKDRPIFKLRVEGKESWSFADIRPNWLVDNPEKDANPWNEVSRKVLDG